MPDDPRRLLADQQLQLVRAMTGGEAPAGFDEARVALAAITLLNKRCRTAGHCWPALVDSLGDQFNELFSQYAGECPLPSSGGGITDGAGFMKWLNRRGLLGDGGRILLLAYRIRRGFIGFARLSNPKAIAIAFRPPWSKSHGWITIFPPGVKRRMNSALTGVSA